MKEKKIPSITVKANKHGKHVMPLLNVLRVILVPIIFLLKPFKIYGRKKVEDGACIYISNHYGLFDPVYPVVTTWEGVHFISKKETFEAPILGFFMRKIKALRVYRDGNDARALLDSLKCLKNNEKIVIYPEGSRNKVSDEIRPFKHGAAVMAIRTKTPIVPLVICKRPKFFRCTPIMIGENIELTEYYDRKLTDEDYLEAEEKLRNALISLREEYFEKYSKKKA